MKKITVTTASQSQSAIPELGKEEKTVYFLKLGDDPKSITINVGEKTYKSIKQMLDEIPNSTTPAEKTKQK